MDSSPNSKLQMFFFPYILGGHLIPMIDVARVFASHGAKATIVTTPHNALLFQKPIERDQQLGHDIGFRTLDFPAEEFGLPDGCENELNTTSGVMFAKLFEATMKVLQHPLEQLLIQTQPDCFVSDRLYPWTAQVANKLGVPRIVFDGTGCFSHCVEESIRRHSPHEKALSDTEPFVLPGLPDKIELKRSMLPNYVKAVDVVTYFLNEALEGELQSYGVVVNSFYELEQRYADYFTHEMGRKTWHIGPVSLCNRNNIDKVERGIKTTIDELSVLNWLDSKQPNSVIYISFGSMPRITPLQLLEIAHGLETSNHSFIWVVGRILNSSDEGKEDNNNLLPPKFEEKLKISRRGLVIKGWAPQLLILEHPAIGGYMNHCGWNSIIEGVTAGVPMITWPFASEQFYNERFVIDVIQVGMSIGNEEYWEPWKALPRVTVKREQVTNVVNRLMGGEDEQVLEMRKRARGFAEKARKAVEKGGSSYGSVVSFIEELKSCRRRRNGVEESAGEEC